MTQFKMDITYSVTINMPDNCTFTDMITESLYQVHKREFDPDHVYFTRLNDTGEPLHEKKEITLARR